MGAVFGASWYVTMVGRVGKLERQKQELITMEFFDENDGGLGGRGEFGR